MKSVIKISSLFLIAFIYSCKGRKNNDRLTVPETSNQTSCAPYFQFDKIEHYYLDIDEAVLWDTEQKEIKTEKQAKQLALLMQRNPTILSDSQLLKDLDKLDFIKKVLPAHMFNSISDVFCQRAHEHFTETTCIAVYRDILIFKKENKTIGFAKICFGCGHNVITGTSLNTDEFGQSGDYEKLFNMLH